GIQSRSLSVRISANRMLFASRACGTWDLWASGLAINRGTQMKAPKTLQRMKASAGNGVEQVAIQHGQGLFAHQAGIDHATHPPIEDGPVEFAIVVANKLHQLGARSVV